jgi:hypothetical protein
MQALEACFAEELEETEGNRQIRDFGINKAKKGGEEHDTKPGKMAMLGLLSTTPCRVETDDG